MGLAEWGRCDLQQFVCSLEGRVIEGPFDHITEGPPAGSGTKIHSVMPALKLDHHSLRLGRVQVPVSRGVVQTIQQSPSWLSPRWPMYLYSSLHSLLPFGPR